MIARFFHASGKATAVIGNQEPAGNVGTESFALDGTGRPVRRTQNPIICAIEVLK